MKNHYIVSLTLALGAIAPVSATPLIGTDLTRFSVVAGGYATYGAGAVVSGEVGAVQYVTAGAGGTSAGDQVNSAGVTNALSQLSEAQSALNRMTTTATLAPTVSGILDLQPGVYSASALTSAAGTTINLDGGGLDNAVWVFNIGTYLVTGDSTKINIVNAGNNASVIWNTGGYVAMGANTAFIGTVMSNEYITQGAGSAFACGNLFAQSYVTVAANATLTSTSCSATGSWAGSALGLASNLDNVNGVAQARAIDPDPAPTPTDVAEPGTIFLFLAGLGLIAYLGNRTRPAPARKDGAAAVPAA